jgi:hypothetical protein
MIHTVTHTPARAPAAPVGVDELKRAWHAVRAGEFRPPQRRNRPDRHPSTRAAHTWTPHPWEEPVVVLGCAGSSGATTVALAMGLSATAPVRVVECGSVSTSALASASTAELGQHADGGWLLGRRDHVQLERASEIIPGPHAVAHPIPAKPLTTTERDEQKVVQSCLTILDAGWEAGQLLATASWIAEAVRNVDHLVLTTRATTPGLRRLEGVLDLLAGTRGREHLKVAVIGARRKKWPRGLEQAGGPGVRRVLDAGKYVEIPEVPALAVAGLDSRPLPAGVVDAARRLLPTHGQHHRDTNPTREPTKGTRLWTP